MVMCLSFESARQTMDPTGLLFLDLSAGTLYLHLFAIHSCYGQFRRQLKTSLLRQAHRPRARAVVTAISHNSTLNK